LFKTWDFAVCGGGSPHLTSTVNIAAMKEC